jgi:pyruvate carboxylase
MMFDLRNIFAVSKYFYKSKNYCTHFVRPHVQLGIEIFRVFQIIAKNNHAHVIKQDICNKFNELKFSDGCMVWV